MRNYIKKCFLFATAFCLLNLLITALSCTPIFEPLVAALTGSSEFNGSVQWVQITQEAIQDTHANPNAKFVILGDSVAHNFFVPVKARNPQYCVISGNAGFLMIGEYCMLQEALRFHPDLERVYLVLRPETFGEHLNGRYSYQFVALPFYNRSYRGYLTTETKQEMARLFSPIALTEPFKWAFMRSRFIQKVFLNGIYDASYKAQDTMSAESARYLALMLEACEQHGVELVALACPVADTAYNRQVGENVRQALAAYGLLEKMPCYFDSQMYYPPEVFYDGFHFAEPGKYFPEVLARYQQVTGGMLDLQWEETDYE